jgi:Tfp pilus tip-associated adhesin PilY1
MNARFSARFSRSVLLALLLALSPFSRGEATELADAPISSASSADIKPNVVFIMDDSGSMEWDFLPDWANEGNDKPKNLHRFANANYNGLAYNPAIVYVPPKYFDESGVLDETTYLDQDAGNTSEWTAVKVDGYGVQSTGTTSLKTPYPESGVAYLGSAFYYTTVPGEYCTDRTLRDCSATPKFCKDETLGDCADTEEEDYTVPKYTVPAYLRWCKTAAIAQEASPAVGACQAIRIDAPNTVIPAAVPRFTHPRMPLPWAAKLTFSSGTVTAITVDSKNILSGEASSAAGIAANINKCTYKLVDSCQIFGYKASVDGNNITITAPGLPEIAMPSVTGGSVSVVGFAKQNSVPGENLMTVITSSIATYPKAASRFDCTEEAGKCTYAEEMKNYANWYAYYRTRMQAMKTAASRSFEEIDDKYRIGYFTINNNLGTDFRNIADFNGANKKAWYDQLFASKPKDETPLRAALSNAGKLYAHKLPANKLNNVAAEDPMQYYCQAAVTILSTDGYWNKGNGSQLNGAAIGDWDGGDKTEPPDNKAVDRPQLDGGAGRLRKKETQWKKTITPTGYTWHQTATTSQWYYRDLKWVVTPYDQPAYQTSTLWSQNSKRTQWIWYLQAKKSVYHGASASVQTYDEHNLKKKTGPRKYRDWKLQVRTQDVKKGRKQKLEMKRQLVAKQTSVPMKKVTKVQQSEDGGQTWSDIGETETCEMTASSMQRCQMKPSPETEIEVSNGGSCIPQPGGETTTGNTNETRIYKYSAKVECQYTAWTPTTGTPVGEPVTTCSAVAQRHNPAVNPAVNCNFAGEDVWGSVDSCSPNAAEGLSCRYGDWSEWTPNPSCEAKTASNYNLSEQIECDWYWSEFADATEYTPALNKTYQYVVIKSQTVGPMEEWQLGACDGEDLAETPSPEAYSGALAVRTCKTDWGAWDDNSNNGFESCQKDTSKTASTWVDCEYSPTRNRWGDWTSHPLYPGQASCSGKGGVSSPSQTDYVGPLRHCGHRWDGTTQNVVNTCDQSNPEETCSIGWTDWYGVDECTPTVAVGSAENPPKSVGITLCQYTDNGVGGTELGDGVTCSSNPRKENGVANFTYNDTRQLTVGRKYTPKIAVECHVDWGDTEGAYSPKPVVPPATSCTEVAGVTKCGYSEWSAEASDNCPSSTGKSVARSEGPVYTVLTAYKCYNTPGKPTDWPGSEDCTDVTGERTCRKEAKEDWSPYTSFNSNDQSASPASQTLKEFKRVPDAAPGTADYTPAQASASPEDMAPSNTPCTGGIVNGQVNWCKSVVPLPWGPKFVADCTEQLATTATDGVGIGCSNQKSKDWVDDSTCTEQEGTEGNNYLWRECQPGYGTPTSDTLADVAQYYWRTDLRDKATWDNCAGSPVDEEGTQHNVCTNTGAINRQFMTTYTLGMGISGVMQYQSEYATLVPKDPEDLTVTVGDYDSVKRGVTANPGEGICAWQEAGRCNWPKPVSDQQTAVDDLWHAAVNGRGEYYSADNPADVAKGIKGALERIIAKGGSLAAPTFNSALLDANSMAYVVEFHAGTWVGDVKKYAVDPLSKKLTTLQWSAGNVLDSRSGERTIFTYAASGADRKKPFVWSELSTEEKAHFTNPSLTQLCTTGTTCVVAEEQDNAKGENLVKFLRGDRTHEGDLTDVAKYYRRRASRLGDIVGSEAVYVQSPPWSYNDDGYSAFRTAHKDRAAMLYAGANDGMLHAFKEADGSEVWAYVPSFVLPYMYQLADKSYVHRFFVDGKPVMGDICINNCDNISAEWRTLLVGGLNHGGRGYYALDITSPDAPKVLWEFSHDKLGFSYGNPVISKLANGTWAVFVTSGYNNPDGKGHLFVINAHTGVLIGDPIATGAGSEDSPSGLAKISAWSNYPVYNNTALRLYGGDLLGNLWRFDVNAETPRAQLMTTLKAGDVAQPITVAPELGLVKNHPVVFIGTGRLLGPSDTSTTGQQSIYAIKDPLTSTEDDGPLYPTSPRADMAFVSQEIVLDTCSAGREKFCAEDDPILVIKRPENTVNWATHNGWFVDFGVSKDVNDSQAEAGERLNTNIRLVDGRLGFSTNTPKNGVCIPAGTSRFYALNYETGGSTDEMDGQAVYGENDNMSSDSNIVIDGSTGDSGFSTGTDCIGEECPKFNFPPIDPHRPGARRVSWRQLFIE